MLRLYLAVLSVFAASALAEARACTILPPRFEAGTAEAIAEERALNTRTAKWIADSELVFVGKFVKAREVDLAEIAVGRSGEFGPSDISGEALVPAVRWWFEPTRMLKGSAPLPTANLFMGWYGVACGLWPSLEKGEAAVVSANRSPSGYWYGDVSELDVLPYVEAELARR